MGTSYDRVGTDANARPALLAPGAAAWWRAFALLVHATLGLNLAIIQARGDYSGSGGTHSDGWAIDIRTRDFDRDTIARLVMLARRCGASATWYRTTVGSGPHIHLVVDAGDLYTASRYQTRAVRAGYNGLGRLGRSGRDTHPAPDRWRTYTEGLAYMATLLPKEENVNMPLTQDEWARLTTLVRNEIKYAHPQIADAVAAAVWRFYLGSSGPTAGVALQNTVNYVATLVGQIAGLQAAGAAVNAGQPIDIGAVRAAARAGVADALSSIEAKA